MCFTYEAINIIVQVRSAYHTAFLLPRNLFQSNPYRSLHSMQCVNFTKMAYVSLWHTVRQSQVCLTATKNEQYLQLYMPHRKQSVLLYRYEKPTIFTAIYTVNPFTAPPCKISRLKSAHMHACKQYIWWSYNKSTFSPVHFDRILFTCSCEGVEKPEWFQIWHFYRWFSWWQSGKHGSERVNTMDSEQ